MKVVALVGGVGGARFLLGVKAALGLPAVGEPEQPAENEVTALVNTGDDVWMHGLRICPDLDTCMYTLSGAIDQERGWGHRGETWSVSEELVAYGAEPSWFGLGDRDVATHLVRSRMLRAGYGLSDVTEALCARWRPGARLLPVTDDRVETHVAIDDPDTGEQRAVHFQEWWVRYRSEPRAHAIVLVGADEAQPTEQVRKALAEADLVLVAPSNPVVSVGTLLAVPGFRDALRQAPAPVVGVSPIIGGSPLRGMADKCLSAIGVETSAEAVGRHYGPRGADGILDAWLIHSGETADVPGVAVRSTPLIMSDVDATAEMARAAFEAAGIGAPEVGR